MAVTHGRLIRVSTTEDEGTPAVDLVLAREVLAAQPFSVLLGARVVAFGDGSATLELDIRDDLRQQHGVVHGGVLSYLADNALTFAAGTALGPNVRTAGYTVDYLRPAVGGVLRAVATVLTAGRTRAVCRCEVSVVDGEGAERPCAAAQGTILVVSG